MMINAIIERDENGYFAYVPEFKGCVSQGDSYEETLANIQEASELYLQSLRNDEISALKAKFTSIVPLQLHANA